MLNKLLHKTKTKFVTNSQGFTLIELLIVIVIIGILAGVLIAVIDPAAQQNRARDANVQATVNKLALAINAYIAAYGTLPTSLQLTTDIASGTLTPVSGCTAGTPDECIFTYSNTALASTCNAAAGTSYYGPSTATGLCSWRYLRSGTSYALYAKSYGRPSDVFKYTSGNSQIQICNGTPTNNMAGC